MSIQVIGIERVEASLRSMDPKAAIILKRQMNIACEMLRERIVDDLAAGTWGIKSRRGTAGLAGSVHQEPAVETPDGIVGEVRGAAPPFQYGAYFEKGGRGPYDIIGKPVLAWPAYGNFQSGTRQKKFAFTADMIFARRVRHPAIKKAPWMSGPFQELRGQIMGLLKLENLQGEVFG